MSMEGAGLLDMPVRVAFERATDSPGRSVLIDRQRTMTIDTV